MYRVRVRARDRPDSLSGALAAAGQIPPPATVNDAMAGSPGRAPQGRGRPGDGASASAASRSSADGGAVVASASPPPPGGALDAVHALRSMASECALDGVSGALAAAAARLRVTLTREDGVDGHEVLDCMVTALDEMRRVAESASTSSPLAGAPERAALRDHARALDASERERDKYRAMLLDAERDAESLLAMNAALKSELEMQAAMHATDVAYEHKGGDLMARELEATRAQLAVVSEGFQLLKNERHEATTVLRAQATVRAALDEERAAVARMRRSLSEKRGSARGSGDAGDAGAGGASSSSSSDDVAALRAALSASDERVEALRLDLQNARESEASAIEKLNAARDFAAVGDDALAAAYNAELEAATSRAIAAEEGLEQTRARAAALEEEVADARREKEAALRRAVETAEEMREVRDAAAAAERGWKKPTTNAAKASPYKVPTKSPAKKRDVDDAKPDDVGDLRVELELLHEWKHAAEGEMSALRAQLRNARDANARLERTVMHAERDAVHAENAALALRRRRSEFAPSISPMESDSTHLPSIGEEGEYLEDATTAEAEDEDPGALPWTDDTGAAAIDSTSAGMMREMWAELQHIRGCYKSLHNKYARQSQRFVRLEERLRVVGGGGGGGHDDGDDDGNALAGPTDSARSSVIMGELSDGEMDVGEMDDGDARWIPGTPSARAVAAAAAAVAAGIHHRPASGEHHDVTEVDEGMDGEDEVLAEYVSTTPPRAPRGHRATQEALTIARQTSSHRPDSAPPSERRFTNSMRRRGERAAPAKAVVRAASSSMHRPGSAPSSQDRMTNSSLRRGEPPASAAARAAAAAAGAARPGSATPSNLRVSHAASSTAPRPPPSALSAAAAASASRPQTGPSSQQRRTRRPQTAAPSTSAAAAAAAAAAAGARPLTASGGARPSARRPASADPSSPDRRTSQSVVTYPPNASATKSIRVGDDDDDGDGDDGDGGAFEADAFDHDAERAIAAHRSQSYVSPSKDIIPGASPGRPAVSARRPATSPGRVDGQRSSPAKRGPGSGSGSAAASSERPAFRPGGVARARPATAAAAMLASEVGFIADDEMTWRARAQGGGKTRSPARSKPPPPPPLTTPRSPAFAPRPACCNRASCACGLLSADAATRRRAKQARR